MVSRRYFLEKELWFHVGILHEDEPYTFKALLYADRAGCANKTFYYNRVRENSITTSKSSFARAYGCFAGALDCGEAMSSLEEKGYDIPELLFKQVMRLNGTAVIRYAECTEEEKDKRKQLSLPDRILFEQTVVSAFELKRKLESEKERTQQYKIAAEIGYRNIRNSYSFKLFTCFVWEKYISNNGISIMDISKLFSLNAKRQIMFCSCYDTSKRNGILFFNINIEDNEFVESFYET